MLLYSAEEHKTFIILTFYDNEIEDFCHFFSQNSYEDELNLSVLEIVDHLLMSAVQLWLICNHRSYNKVE